MGLSVQANDLNDEQSRRRSVGKERPPIADSDVGRHPSRH
jgi:hypothetical protein